MNTRQRVRCEASPPPCPQKMNFRASLGELQHDLQQMTDEPVLVKKKPRATQMDYDLPNTRHSLKQAPGKNLDVTSAVLGFATFIIELESTEISDTPLKKKVPNEAAKDPLREIAKLRQMLNQPSNQPPFQVTKVQNPALQQFRNSQPPPVARSPHKITPTVQRELPRSATHVKIAKFVQGNKVVGNN